MSQQLDFLKQAYEDNLGSFYGKTSEFEKPLRGKNICRSEFYGFTFLQSYFRNICPFRGIFEEPAIYISLDGSVRHL